jgi:hypothetical protein
MRIQRCFRGPPRGRHKSCRHGRKPHLASSPARSIAAHHIGVEAVAFVRSIQADRRNFASHRGLTTHHCRTRSQCRTNESLIRRALQKRKLQILEQRLRAECHAFRLENSNYWAPDTEPSRVTHGISGLFRKVSRRAKIIGLRGWAGRIRTGEGRNSPGSPDDPGDRNRPLLASPPTYSSRSYPAFPSQELGLPSFFALVGGTIAPENLMIPWNGFVSHLSLTHCFS